MRITCTIYSKSNGEWPTKRSTTYIFFLSSFFLQPFLFFVLLRWPHSFNGISLSISKHNECVGLCFVYQLPVFSFFFFYPFRVNKSCFNKIIEHNFYVMNIEAPHSFWLYFVWLSDSIFYWLRPILSFNVSNIIESDWIEQNYLFKVVTVNFCVGQMNKNRKAFW